ncbi:hypothetical protein P389DRAFT_89483 [Cystobasidium minutum MCA 4210]|uniref:uncharacterized protein n=1 Tax=Cystobasidium minutum MCA 4210 TaxID=1397322 RepID=UPI0034CDF5EE|eukprot:jgi/Rhomi1/89483/CE89482_314
MEEQCVERRQEEHAPYFSRRKSYASGKVQAFVHLSFDVSLDCQTSFGVRSGWQHRRTVRLRQTFSESRGLSDGVPLCKASSTQRLGSRNYIFQICFFLYFIWILAGKEVSTSHRLRISLPEELVVESVIQISACLSHRQCSVWITCEHQCLHYFVWQVQQFDGKTVWVGRHIG